MKLLIMVLALVMSLTVLAEDPNPVGVFQVTLSPSAHSVPLSGIVELKNPFQESSFHLETPDSIFKSNLVTGDLSNFKLKGTITEGGKTSELTFSGTYFGIIRKEDGSEKIIIKLVSERFAFNIIASRPQVSMTELHNTVREIFQ